ncbi:VWA domain-containing protein [bacterium]|nr:VWA domain-containing protein [bacterium]
MQRIIPPPVGQSGLTRRGAMLVLIAALLSVMLILVVFTTDVAYMQLVRTQLHVSTDAAAKAGMEALARTESRRNARVVAKDIFSKNLIGGRELKLHNKDIEFGRTDANPDGTWEFLPNERPFQAIRISVNLDDNRQKGRNGSVPLLFGKVLGQSSFATNHSSVAANLVHEIVLCLDRSHSMCFDETGVDYAYPPGTPSYPAGYITPPNPVGSRWAKLQGAIQVFVDTLDDLQIVPDVGVVTWGSDITLSWSWYPFQGRSFPAVMVDVPLGQNLNLVSPAIAAKLGDIMMGGTNMSSGIDRSVSLLTANGTHSLAQKTIILMSDGQWNAGRNPLDAANDAADKNITIHTIAFLNGDQSVMRQIAERTGGKFFNAPDGESLEDTFKELAKMLPVVLVD